MRKLAVEGGIPLVRKPIRALNTVSTAQVGAVNAFMAACRDGKATLSGYLAGSQRGGTAVQRLEDAFAREFGVRHAIACSSGTSAIMAAVLACGGIPNAPIVVPAMGMSAVAAVPKILGLKVIFADIDDYFCLARPPESSIIIAVNLFGHPAKLHEFQKKGAFLIEDNCQAPWAMEDDVYTGCVGDIGCWSMNVHKPMNAGEGGMCTTNNDHIAAELRSIVNHGEVSGYDQPGLNLRMTEFTAVMVLAQLQEAKQIVESRRHLALELNLAEVQGGLMLPAEHRTCKSSWYCYAMLAHDCKARDWAAKALQAEGIPARAGYILMPEMPAFADIEGEWTRAKELNDRLVLIELCSIDPDKQQVEQMTEAIACIGEHLE